MGAGEVEIFGVTMSFWDRGRAERNACPVETNACHMRLFDVTPAAEPMQPIFQFVMMPGQDEETDKEAGERAVAGLRPAPSMHHDGSQQADRKNRKPPAGKPFAEPPALCIQTVDAAQYPQQTGLSIWRTMRFDSWLHRMLTILIV